MRSALGTLLMVNCAGSRTTELGCKGCNGMHGWKKKFQNMKERILLHTILVYFQLDSIVVYVDRSRYVQFTVYTIKSMW